MKSVQNSVSPIKKLELLNYKRVRGRIQDKVFWGVDGKLWSILWPLKLEIEKARE